MKALLFLFFLCYFASSSAQTIQTIVPGQSVVMGTAFQVQYVITEPAGLINADTPSFKECRLVSGPNFYKGTATVGGRSQAIRNITYTLVPLRIGRLKIEGIRAHFKGNIDKKADDAF